MSLKWTDYAPVDRALNQHIPAALYPSPGPQPQPQLHPKSPFQPNPLPTKSTNSTA